MINIAIMGYGTIGSGVAEAFYTNSHIINERAGQDISLKYVLDLRDFPGSPVEQVLIKDFNAILNDGDVRIVVETMGGVGAAYDFVSALLRRGKSVVTSNKELVAKHGAALFALARGSGANFLFGASVGGGIPVVRPLNSCLTGDRITEISGILNGTTNYILTEMTQNNKGFNEALSEAQRLGYAERDSSDDILGLDTCRKLAILISVITGEKVEASDIHTEGIDKITIDDIRYAKTINGNVKLIARANITQDGVWATVSPAIVTGGHPLNMVNGVFNGILIKANISGDLMFYGRGAGKLPTAGAVTADVIECAKNLNRNVSCFWTDEKRRVYDIGDNICRKLARVSCKDGERAMDKAIEKAQQIFKCKQVYVLSEHRDEFAFVTEAMPEKTLGGQIKELLECENINGILSLLRIEGTGETKSASKSETKSVSKSKTKSVV